MDVSLLNPTRYLKSQELKGDATFTIARPPWLEELAAEDGEEIEKGLISFKETKKLWVINVTNALCIKAMFGRETDAWVGKRVTLYAAPWTDQMTKEATTCLRVRGSPDLAGDVHFILKLARKKPKPMVMKKTVAGVRTEPPAERLLREASSLGHDKAAVKALLEEIAPGKVKVQSDVTEELAAQVLARLQASAAPAGKP